MPVWVAAEIVKGPLSDSPLTHKLGIEGQMKVSEAVITMVVGLLQMMEFHPFFSLVCWVASCPFDKIIINNLVNLVNDDSYKHECMAIHEV